MSEKLIFKNEALVKMWANTTVIRKDGDILIVQYFRDNMYYYFEKINGVYNHIMTSEKLLNKEAL